MKKFLTVVAMLASVSAFAAEKKMAAPAASKDAAIKAIFAKVDEGFAKHDAKSFGALFADDATFIGPMGDGKLVKGREEIVKMHEGMMTSPEMKDVTSTHTVENIRWIGKDAALVDATVAFNGMKMPENAPAPVWHAVVLVQMKKGHWMLEDVRPYAIMPMAPHEDGKGM